MSAVSRTLGIRRADLVGARSAHCDIQLYLAAGGVPVAPLTLPAGQFVPGVESDCVVVRDYADHRGLPRVLAAAGIASTVSRTTAGGAPVVIMRVTACLLAKLLHPRGLREVAA